MQQARRSRHPSRAMMGRLAVAMITLCALPQATRAQGTTVSGTVRYYSNEARVADVAVQLVGIGEMHGMTDPAGAYAFTAPGSAGFMLQPTKTGGVNGAVSALDASWILQSVVGLRQLSPNQMLACDVTGDGSVSPLDAARILQLVAGLRARLPVAESCGSDWAFVPAPAAIPGQHVVAPQMSPACSPGAIVFDQLLTPADAQDFLAIAFGDCTGNWQGASAPPPSASPTASVTPTGTANPTPTSSSVPTATGIPATATRTLSPSITATSTRTTTPTRTATFTTTPTRTGTMTPTRPPTVTATPTRTGTPTLSPTSTYTATPTPTAPCPNGLAWDLTEPVLISAQSGGNLWLTKTVPTASGWGIFWLRQDPAAPNSARLYYAHVDFSGQITQGPVLVISIPKIAFRGRYYLAAWHTDHYGVLTAEQSTLVYYNMSMAGVLSGRKVLSVPLFTSTIYDQESDGDMDSYPGGFLGVIEGECAGHSCAYAIRVDPNGTALTAPLNLVDFDLTHQFYPRAVFDGDGFVILSVKDIQISGGGVMTKYWPLVGPVSSHAKVVPAKEYLWDEFPDIAWNGDHFAAVWTENSARSHAAPWQIRFATFRRTRTASTLIGQRIIDVVASKTNHRWTTQVHAVGDKWVAQYATRATDGSIRAVYELLGSNAATEARLVPYELSADALGSSPHTAAGHAGELGIARGANFTSSTEVTFQRLPPPACAP